MGVSTQAVPCGKVVSREADNINNMIEVPNNGIAFVPDIRVFSSMLPCEKQRT